LPGPRRGSLWLLLLSILLLAGCASAQAAGTQRVYLPSLGREPTATPRPPALVGQVLRGLGAIQGRLRGVVTGFEITPVVSAPSGTLTADGTFLVVFLDVTNEGPEPDFISDSLVGLFAEDASRRRFDLFPGPQQWVAREAYRRVPELELVEPGATVPMLFVFDVQPDSADVRLGQWSNEPTATAGPPLPTATPTSTPTATPTFPPTATAIAAQASMAVAYQGNPGHDGSVATTIAPPLVQLWSVDLGADVSYPLIAEGRVYVATPRGGSVGYGAKLYALNARSGQVVWGPVVIDGAYGQAHAAYDAGRLFVVSRDGVRAYAAASGALLWTQRLHGGVWYQPAPPVASQGVVYVSGTWLVALDEATGRLLWTHDDGSGHSNPASPVLTADGVALSNGTCLTVFARLTGQRRWKYPAGCREGGIGYAVTAHAGRVFNRNDAAGGVFDAQTGARLRGLASSLPVAVTDRAVFTVDRTLLTATTPETGARLWASAAAEPFTAGPLAVGPWVYVGTGSGGLLAVQASSGQVVWTGSLGRPIPPPDELLWGGSPVAGMNAGEGILVVPAGRTLTAYRGS
jgi:outer membrane protein assembly factor BamB